jgi:DNA-binding GntR family transcriptional regulator
MTIRPNRIVDQVSHYLREQVFRGALRAGDRLVEKKIAEQLGTGQNAVREALIELSSRGFVHRTANRGTYVMDLSLEEARKISWLRCELELLALDLVLENIRSQANPWSGLEALLHRMEEAHSRGDSAAQRTSDFAFHQAFWAMSGNEVLCQMLERVAVPIFILVATLSGPEEAPETGALILQRHRNLLNAFRSNERERARRAIRDHSQTTLDFVKTLETREPVALNT